MFRKRTKKHFPPGTFIPTPARVAAIIQLCLAFSLIAWCCGQPFMGELFSVKSKILIFEYVMGAQSDHSYSKVDKELMERNQERFESLPTELKELLIEKHRSLQLLLNGSFLSKIMRMMNILLFERSPFEMAWIFLAIATSIFLLMRIEGAREAAWLLPVLAAAYSVDNYVYGKNFTLSEEAKLFPTEQVIVNRYLNEPLDKDIFKQRDQLLIGWKAYLIQEWAKETPSLDSEVFKNQAEKGEYAFTIARAERLENKIENHHSQKESVFLLLLYLSWNLFLAYFVNRNLKKEKLITQFY